MTDARTFFETRVNRTETCWVWTGGKNVDGYGQMWVGSRPTRTKQFAHRVSYELFVGPIPSGMELDHLCRTPACVNPDHLEAVTRAENQRRGRNPELLRQRAASVTACPRGHAYDEANTYRRSGRRSCRSCRREADRRRIQHPEAKEKRAKYMRDYYQRRRVTD